MPVKFDDLNKVAKSVLNDDYVNMGSPFQFKAKQKADGVGGTVTTTVDLKDKTSTSVSWKLPSAFAVKGFNVDKFEYNKNGNMKFEAVIDKTLHKVEGLTVDLKTDLSDPMAKLVKGVTFTGIKDTQLKFETKVLQPNAFTAEVTRTVCPAQVGVKVAGGNIDLGARGTVSGIFASLLVTKGFSTYETMFQYKVNPTLEVAASATKDPKSMSALAGFKYALNNDVTLKAKVSGKSDATSAAMATTATAAVIYKAAKGMTVTGGAAFGKALSYGVQISVE